MSESGSFPCLAKTCLLEHSPQKSWKTGGPKAICASSASKFLRASSVNRSLRARLSEKVSLSEQVHVSKLSEQVFYASSSPLSKLSESEILRASCLSKFSVQVLYTSPLSKPAQKTRREELFGCFCKSKQDLVLWSMLHA